MEKNISVEERIKRAEERYYNTLNRDYNNIKNEDNIQSNKKNITERTNKKRTLKRKVLTQIVICLIAYGIFYCINNTNSLFSNDMKQKTKEILNTDINFSQIYSNLKCNIEKFFQNIGILSSCHSHRNLHFLHPTLLSARHGARGALFKSA